MIIEKAILLVSWIVASTCIWFFVPRDKIRNFIVAFLFKQSITWISGLLVVEMGLIQYPVRIFQIATTASFTFEFYVYPVICAFFNIYYPEDSTNTYKFFYYAIICSIITVLEVILEQHTQLIRYIHWEWYWTWITLFLTFYLSRVYYRWHFKVNKAA
ncbi:hypothetical protein SDC9_15041 [bioreactor metagenome]|uniref:Uncharacterized protein n=1 Tax=bioreactor metagenome TaxID=1076179 RepID=A0A644TQS6_9ZZZZ